MRFRASTWLLATGGVFVGHILGYAAAHPDTADRTAALAGHAYFGPAASVVVPVAAVALLAVAIQTVRRLGESPAFAELAVAQIGLFVVQEMVERVNSAGGPLEAFHERGVLAGVVAQLVVAWVTARLVRAVAAVVRAIESGVAYVPSVAPAVRVRSLARVAPCPRVALRLPKRRGPPLSVGAATSL